MRQTPKWSQSVSKNPHSDEVLRLFPAPTILTKVRRSSAGSAQLTKPVTATLTTRQVAADPPVELSGFWQFYVSPLKTCNTLRRRPVPSHSSTRRHLLMLLGVLWFCTKCIVINTFSDNSIIYPFQTQNDLIDLKSLHSPAVCRHQSLCTSIYPCSYELRCGM